MSNPPQDQIEVAFGPLVAGIMVQQLLFGVVCVQVFDYYRVFVKDVLIYKILVGLLFGLNALLGAMDFYALYRTSVQYYDNFEGVDLQTWATWGEPIVTATIGMMAQVYFLERCYRATTSWLITSILGLMVLTSFVSGVAVGVGFSYIQRFSQVAVISIQVTVWLITTAVTDIAIAGVLVIALIRSKTPFKTTERVIFRIARLSMETSSTTAIVALLNLTFYKAIPGTAYHAIPQYSIGRLYTSAVLVTLSSRTEIRNLFFGGGHSSYVTRSEGQMDDRWKIQNIKVTTVVHERSHSWRELSNDAKLGSSESNIRCVDEWNKPSGKSTVEAL